MFTLNALTYVNIYGPIEFWIKISFGLFNVFESWSFGLSYVMAFIQVSVVCLHISCYLPRSPFLSKSYTSAKGTAVNN